MSESIYDKYETVIGLEVHVQLKTESKIFAPDSTAFGKDPNTNISFITLGHPGTLPRVNQKVVNYAIRLGLATNCYIEQNTSFDRKNYFYADLPKGYQVSQFNKPICKKGYVDIESEGKLKRIGITQIHLEEDAGKSSHEGNDKFSQIDLNRAGVPLLEIVSDPEMRNGDEAYAYLTKIRRLVQYLDICDGNLEEGSMRCDANVSVRLKGCKDLGQRTEVKNMNSLRNVKRAIKHESKRQIDLIEKGGRVVMQTRSFNADDGSTFELRSKEMAHDYRYFPEPDLPLISISDDYIESVKSNLPALPDQLFEKFTSDLGLTEYDSNILVEDPDIAHFFCEALKISSNDKNTKVKAIANWIIGPIKKHLNSELVSISDIEFSPSLLVELTDLVEKGTISYSAAQQSLFPAILKQKRGDLLELAQELNLIMDSNTDSLGDVIMEILNDFPDKVKTYKNGRKGLIGFFMGELMKRSKGKADPKKSKAIMENALDSL